MDMNQFNTDQLICIYGLLQVELKREKILNNLGAPISNNKLSEANLDALGLYKWLAEKLISVPEITINDRKQVFNNIVKGLEQNYLLNMSLFSIFLFEDMITRDGTTPNKIVLMPKINRLAKHLRKGIIKANDDGLRIVRDSKRGSSNVMRIFNGEPELIKEVRDLNLEKWRNIAKNKRKIDED